MIKLKVKKSELESHFNTVEHETFRKDLSEHWKVVGDNVKAQSVCWLFCWAKTGMNSPKAMQQCRKVFDKIFLTISYSDFDKKVSHEWAREARYRTENIQDELNDLLNGKHVGNKETNSSRAKYKNDDFNKKRFMKYRTNKNKLIGFEAAERFLLRLESMDEGFYISPRTNLHCYYKDRYLFYLHDFSQFSIKLRQQYNNIINKATYDYSVQFFEHLKSKINSTKGISITESGICTFEIGNSDNADYLFDFIYNEMQIIAREIDNDSKEEQDEDFEEKIEEARELTKEERLSRLKNYPEYPTSSEKKTISYNRNQYVVVEVLERANGKCELCMQDAPFARATDGTPYLEVHHIVQLSDGGKDTIDNAIALCPNCHRGAHYGGFKIKNIKRQHR